MGSLSRRANSEPVSDPLQAGIRFFQLPAPAPPSAFLAVGLPVRARMSERPRAFAHAKGGEDRTLVLLAEIPGLQIPLSECVALGTSFRPGDRRPRAAITRTRLLPPCRLARPVSPFWPLYITIPLLIHLCLPWRLPDAIPGRGSQEPRHLAASRPHRGASRRVRPALDSGP